MQRLDEVIKVGHARRPYQMEQSARKGRVSRNLRVVFKSRPRAGGGAARATNIHFLALTHTHKFPVQTQVRKKRTTTKKIKKNNTTSGVRE